MKKESSLEEDDDEASEDEDEITPLQSQQLSNVDLKKKLNQYKQKIANQNQKNPYSDDYSEQDRSDEGDSPLELLGAKSK